MNMEAEILQLYNISLQELYVLVLVVIATYYSRFDFHYNLAKLASALINIRSTSEHCI